MTVFWLLVAISISALLIDKKSAFPVAVFAMGALIFHVVDSVYPSYPDHLYYIVPAIIDLVILVVISRQSQINAMSMMLVLACIASMVLNFTGWVLYELYFAPTIHNALSSFFYAAVLILIAIRSQRNGVHTAHGYDSKLWGHNQLRSENS